MAGAKRWGPHKPTGGLGYFPPSPGTEGIIAGKIREADELKKMIVQFHGMLEDAILREHHKSINIPGLKAALGLFRGYFGIFNKGEK